MMIYKVFTPGQWDVLQREGSTKGAPIDLADGYIHLSTATQVAETLAKHFAGQSPLVLAAVEEQSVADDLRWEVSRGDALFPHLYRDLALTDVTMHADIALEDGVHGLPDWVE